MFKKVVIIGVGLIGGSIGLALKRRKLAREIVGICRRKSSVSRALKSKACHKATMNMKDGLKGADLVIIATPVGRIVGMAEQIIKNTDHTFLMTDVGSSKGDIVKRIQAIAPKRISFVGSHPMAGSEKSGVEFAKADLFKNSICVVTDGKKTDKSSLGKVTAFWTAIGARVKKLSPEKHDGCVARISHLPHLVSYALAMTVDRESLSYAATGFKDTTRIASSDPVLWADIFLSNRREMLVSAAKYRKICDNIIRLIKSKNKKKLISLLEQAKYLRDGIDG